MADLSSRATFKLLKMRSFAVEKSASFLSVTKTNLVADLCVWTNIMAEN